MVEIFVRTQVGRSDLCRIEVPGPTAMLRIRVRRRDAIKAWDGLKNVVHLVPLWSGFIEQCLVEEPGLLSIAADSGTQKSELLREQTA